jgi:two-component system, NtrC family, response regulator AtoC
MKGPGHLSHALIPTILSLFEVPIALHAILDEMPLGVMLLDAQRRVLVCNRALEGLCGVGREQVRGIPCRDLLRCNLCLRDCPALLAEQRAESITSEGDIISRDRQRIAVRLTSVALRHEDGRVMGFLETIEDLRVLHALNARIQQGYRFSNLIGRSPQMEQLLKVAPMIAETDSAVLIIGETGTGKGLVAAAMHQASQRAKGPFIKVNCGALPKVLLESEIFGYQKEAFAGALEDKPGRLRLARNGTLYLTDIGDLPLALQAKLLAFLDERMVYPVGGTDGFQADVRIIAATHRDLEDMVREGRFHEDLLFRLNMVRLHLPPLRERGGDVALLLDHFLRLFAVRFEKPVDRFSPEARRILLAHSYPGNVRELRNIVEYAVNFCQWEEIRTEHLPAYVNEAPPFGPDAVATNRSAYLVHETPEKALEMGWSALERKLIVEALHQAGGHRSRAAEILGWGRSTLWRKIKLYGIEG